MSVATIKCTLCYAVRTLTTFAMCNAHTHTHALTPNGMKTNINSIKLYFIWMDVRKRRTPRVAIHTFDGAPTNKLSHFFSFLFTLLTLLISLSPHHFVCRFRFVVSSFRACARLFHLLDTLRLWCEERKLNFSF